MEIKESITRYKAIILNILAVLIVLFIVNKINAKLQKNIAVINEEIKSELMKSELLDKIIWTEKKLTSYSKLLISRDESFLISTISSLAAESKVAVVFIKPLSEEEHGNYIKLPFEVTLRSPDYHALGGFIAKLESHNDVFIVESLQIAFNQPQSYLEVRLKVSYVVSEENR